MLDTSNEQSVIEIDWENVPLKAQLPVEMKDFFDEYGTVPSQKGCRRAYHRFLLRGKGVLHHGDAHYGVLTADASRQGLRFLSPVEIPLKERCRIRLPKTKEFQIEIVRCRRIDELCYECGAVFVLGTLPTKN